MNSIADLPPKYNLIYSALPKNKCLWKNHSLRHQMYILTCNQTCKDFEKQRCSRLDKAP